MKKLFLSGIAILSLVIFSCTSKKESTTAKNDEGESINAKTRAVYKAIETGDVSGLDSIIDKDFVDHTSMGDVNGLDSVKAMLTDIHNHFDGLKFEVIAQANSGEYHFSLINFSGTPKDNSMGMEPGKPMSSKGIDLVRIKDGKAVEHWDFMASSEMMKMMQGGMSGDKMRMDTTKTK